MRASWDAPAIGLLLVALPLLAGAGPCPSVCVCKWKGGKQTVECLERALIAVPEKIDSETQVLDLSGNNLQIVPREIFYKANLTNLQKVFLKSCRIGQIGDRAFRGLTNLVELDLSHNLLTGVPSAAFADAPFLRYLGLANNPIQKIEANAFATLASAAKIDLSHCEIQTISPNAFQNLDFLEWLKLNGNKLTELQPKTVEAIAKLRGVELHDNPWICDCKLRAVKEWLSSKKVPHTVDPICRGPERVAGRTFGEMVADDFACKPEILPVSRYVEATTGENGTVICRVGAVPSASVHWYWNGRLLLNNSAFGPHRKILIFEEGNFEKTSSLILTNALETDSGEFYCVAENRAGTAEANFTLHISLRTAGMASLGSGQIAGLGAALVILILAILGVASILLIRLRRLSYSESKTPGQLEVITSSNGSTVSFSVKPAVLSGRTIKEDRPSDRVRISQPEEDPARGPDYGQGGFPRTGNNPDIIRDARPEGTVTSVRYPANCGFDSVLGETVEPRSDPVLQECGIDSRTAPDEEDEGRPRPKPGDYPPDYGLPILEEKFAAGSVAVPVSPNESQHPSAKTLRVWQRGVPVLPPATALKRVLTNSRNSPDEGYQEGCGTDV